MRDPPQYSGLAHIPTWVKLKFASPCFLSGPSLCTGGYHAWRVFPWHQQRPIQRFPSAVCTVPRTPAYSGRCPPTPHSLSRYASVRSLRSLWNGCTDGGWDSHKSWDHFHSSCPCGTELSIPTISITSHSISQCSSIPHHSLLLIFPHINEKAQLLLDFFDRLKRPCPWGRNAFLILCGYG